MPLTTTSKRSGGGMDHVNGQVHPGVGQGARPAAIPRSGSASSAGSSVNRVRPNPLRRDTASTSTIRPKLASQLSNSASSSQSVQQSTSILHLIPRPSFPPSDAFDHAHDESHVHARLLQLARFYLQQHDQNDKPAIYDLQSASMYARLALQTDPTSVPARRLLATTLLHGAQPFPFGPSTVHSSPLSLTFQSTTPLSSASISGAHAAIEVLKDGNQDVFMDVGCARIYAKACAIVGKTKEGKDAMAWTLKIAAERRRNKSLSSSSGSGQSSMIAIPPDLNLKGAEEALVYNDLANLASKGNQYKEAAINYLKAKNLDRWSWTAWVGLCDVGSDENITNMFCGEGYKASYFYADQLEKQLLNHQIDSETVRKTMDDLKARGADYFLTGATAMRDEEGTTSQPLQRMTVTGAANMMRKPVGSTTTGTTSVNATPLFARAGTKEEAATATTAGTKRVRTTTAGSGNGGTVPRLAPGVGQHMKGNGSGIAPTDTHANKRPAVTGFRARGPIAASQQLTMPNARTGGTLAAVRTNEQQRPNSSASGSSRGASDKEILKPRRSARVSTAIIDEPQEQPLANQKTIASRPAAGMGQVRRPISRPATAANAMVDTETGTVGVRKATGAKSVNGETAGASKVLVNAMETAAFESARLAAVWNTVDVRVKELLQTLAMAYYSVKTFHSKCAVLLLRRRRVLSNAERADLKREFNGSAPLDNFTGLDDCYRNTVDVQCLLARAHHDMAHYHLAEKHFVHARRLSPSLDTHMDIFSLTLFHLQREVLLSRLARELSQLDGNSSVSHIAKGNAFALQREHSLALQSFQRACLAAPNCAYAFTLAGYEAHELGFKDKSVRYFRQAINIDKRHWNAFAGLARVYVESERHSSAEYYYRRAITIHQTNPVLWDVYGSVLSSQEKFEEAQEAFGRAISLDPSLAMSHIKLAEILLLQGQDAPEKRVKAHGHLLEAVKHAPEEAHVHLMLAHTYMELGKGSFARIDQGGKKRRISNGGAATQILLPSELQQLGTNGLSGPSSTSRAIGNSTIPNAYQAEIAEHLCAAIDLDPRYVRYVKAMGEGAKAALRGIVSRFMMDANGGGDGSTLLMDSSAIMEGQTVDSMVDLDGDAVLEDATAMTEELNSEEEQEEHPEDEEGHEEEELEGLEDDGSQGEMMQDDIIADDLENDESDNHTTATRHGIDQSDVSMSF